MRYGGKYAGLIVGEKQWWRLISPIAVHAGIIHLISNVIIQVNAALNAALNAAEKAHISFASVCSASCIVSSVLHSFHYK